MLVKSWPLDTCSRSILWPLLFVSAIEHQQDVPFVFFLILLSSVKRGALFLIFFEFLILFGNFQQEVSNFLFSGQGWFPGIWVNWSGHMALLQLLKVSMKLNESGHFSGFQSFSCKRLTMYLVESQNWTRSKGAVTRFLLFSKEAATRSSVTSWHFSSDCSDNNALMNLRLLVSGGSASHPWPCWSKRHTFQVSQKSSANIKMQKLTSQKVSNPKTTLAALPGAKMTPLSAFHLPAWPILQTSHVQGWVRPYGTQGHTRIFVFRVENHSHGKGPGNTRAVYAKTRFSRGLTQTCRTCYQVQTLHKLCMQDLPFLLDI